MSISKEILKILSTGPKAASTVYDLLESRNFQRGSIKATANNLVSKKAIYRSKLNLTHNDSLLSLTDDFSDPNLLKTLIKNKFYGRKNLATLVDHLRLSSPVVTQVEVAKLAALRIGHGATPNWKETNNLINGLMEIGLLKKRSDNDQEWFLNKQLLTKAKIPFSKINLNQSNVAVRESIKYSQTKIISEWLSKNGFVSVNGNKFVTADNLVVSGFGLPFDFLGFCFINGVVKRNLTQKQPHVPLLGDIIIDVCTLTYAESFKNRITEIFGITKQIPMGFILAKGFSPEAFKYLKKEGIYAWAFDNLFGHIVAKTIEDLLEIGQSLAIKNDLDINKLSNIFDGVENFGGPLANLKGQLFELIVAYYAARKGHEDIRLGKKIPLENGTKLDLDVLAKQNITGIFFECKGLKADGFVDYSDVEKHFKTRTPATRKLLLNNTVTNYNKFESIVVTTGNFTDHTITDFENGVFKSKSDTKLDLWDRKKLIQKLKEDGHTSIIKIIERYFS